MKKKKEEPSFWSFKKNYSKNKTKKAKKVKFRLDFSFLFCYNTKDNARKELLCPVHFKKCSVILNLRRLKKLKEDMKHVSSINETAS